MIVVAVGRTMTSTAVSHSALLQDRTWAYPAMIVLIGGFIGYQCYRLAHEFSLGLTALTVFDAFVVWLTWRDWQARRVQP